MNVLAGQWENYIGGIHLDPLPTEYRWIFPERKLYHVWLDVARPLTFVCHDGTRIRQNLDIDQSDLGSTPWMVQWLAPRDEFIASYCMHDSAFRDHGVFIAQPGKTVFEFTPCDVYQANALLGECLRAEYRINGGSSDRFMAWKIRRIVQAVDIFGPAIWARSSRTSYYMRHPERLDTGHGRG